MAKNVKAALTFWKILFHYVAGSSFKKRDRFELALHDSVLVRVEDQVTQAGKKTENYS